MNKQVQRTENLGSVKAVSVADYIIERLVTEGIDHCFGVAGDYVFPICDAVDSSAKVKWIGCANELNASYAADGYARIRGAAMLATTYGVGELSAINGVMGKAERSLVFYVVGMPSYQHEPRPHIPASCGKSPCWAFRNKFSQGQSGAATIPKAARPNVINAATKTPVTRDSRLILRQNYCGFAHAGTPPYMSDERKDTPQDGLAAPG